MAMAAVKATGTAIVTSTARVTATKMAMAIALATATVKVMYTAGQRPLPSFFLEEEGSDTSSSESHPIPFAGRSELIVVQAGKRIHVCKSVCEFYGHAMMVNGFRRGGVGGEEVAEAPFFKKFAKFFWLSAGKGQDRHNE
jgi:hypothetical protein